LAVDDLIFVAAAGGHLFGACMAGYDGHRGWLYAVAVLPAQRRDKIGSSLINHAMAALKQRGCIKINLQIRPTNAPVAAFYQALGFDIEDRLSMGALL
jgi:ribosomal protein S18 acetylase RimI-like enzyme